MLAYIRFEIIRSLRDVTSVVFLIGLPVGLYLVYGRNDAVLEGARFPAFYLVAMALFAVMGPR